MLWDLIRDFFVEHVFGGINSSGQFYTCVIGDFYNVDFNGELATTDTLYVDIGHTLYSGENDVVLENTYISLGSWLSTTATIISISIIVVLCCLFVYKIIKLIGGLIR